MHDTAFYLGCFLDSSSCTCVHQHTLDIIFKSFVEKDRKSCGENAVSCRWVVKAVDLSSPSVWTRCEIDASLILVSVMQHRSSQVPAWTCIMWVKFSFTPLQSVHDHDRISYVPRIIPTCFSGMTAGFCWGEKRDWSTNISPPGYKTLSCFWFLSILSGTATNKITVYKVAWSSSMEAENSSSFIHGCNGRMKIW